MNVQHSRRSILGRLVGAMASTPVAAAAISLPVTARQPLKGPITPDQYIEEMLAIGWQPYAIVQTFRSGKTIMLKGTFETYSPDYPTDEQYLRRRQLLRAVGESGIDFYERTGARLFELGMIHYHD